MLVVVARFVIIFFAVVYILAVTIVAKEKEFNYPKVDWRLSLAGGVAGGMSNAIIYPIGKLLSAYLNCIYDMLIIAAN